MITSRQALYCLLIIASPLLISGGAPVSGESSLLPNNLPRDINRKTQALVRSLARQGFEVMRGSLQLYTEADCPASFEEMETCYGNNPAAPYVVVSVPAWPKEAVDPATDTAFGSHIRAPYHLDSREAIVVLGTLPPDAAYFGLQSYLVTRQGPFDKKGELYNYLISQNDPAFFEKFFTRVPQDPTRMILFASVGNSINNVVIEQQSEAAFNEERAFVITPDQFMNAAVREALNEVSVVDQDTFTEPIPAGLKLGLNRPSDDFVTIIRYAMPKDGGAPGTASDTWRKTLPLAVLRVRDTRPGRHAEPFPPVDLEPKSWESELGLEDGLNQLVLAVVRRCCRPALSPVSQPSWRPPSGNWGPRLGEGT